MAKEQFVRSKPHVNVGVFLLILVLGAAAALVYFLEMGPPPDDSDELLPPPDDGTEANVAFGHVEAEWVLTQEGCVALTLATHVEFTLTVVDTQNPPPGPDSVLLFVLFAPPETLGGLGGGELEPIAAGIWRPQISLFDVSDETHSAQFPVFALESVEGEDAAAGGEEPGQFWKFVIVGGETVGLPNAEAPGAIILGDFSYMPFYGSSPGLGMELPAFDEAPEALVLLIFIPDASGIAGLLSDTAVGESGGPMDLSSLSLGGSSPGIPDYEFDPQTGAIYRFKLGQDEGLVFFPPSLYEISIDKVNPARDSSLWFTPYEMLPYIEQDNLYDMEILEVIPFAAKWATVDGLSGDTNMVEYREGSPICTATPTLTNTAVQVAATPTATQASGGQPAASDTPRPSAMPPRSTTPRATETGGG